MATSANPGRYLVVNGVPRAGDVPPIATLLESISGAYTTTRTHGDGARVLFWDRHLRRLAQSARILFESNAEFIGIDPRRAGVLSPRFEFEHLAGESLRSGLKLALNERGRGVASKEELAITVLLRGQENEGNGVGFDVYLHIGLCATPVFGAGAHLAVVGRGRDVAAAKYSDWVRIRKGLESMRPPWATELLLSNDGDRILEGSVTNFFVVCRKEANHITYQDQCESERGHYFEVQTPPISDGVLPGVIRQLVLEICSSRGIPLKEVAPSWSDREFWEEAFVTSSLRLVQHVETIRAPNSKEKLHLKTWKDVSWIEKSFEGAGLITSHIQRELMERAESGGYQISAMA